MLHMPHLDRPLNLASLSGPRVPNSSKPAKNHSKTALKEPSRPSADQRRVAQPENNNSHERQKHGSRVVRTFFEKISISASVKRRSGEQDDTTNL